MFNENKKSKKEVKSKIIIEDKDGCLSVDIRGSSIELANLLANVFEKHDSFFKTVKMAVEDWDETKKLKEKPFDEQIDVLLEKLEELRNLTRKIN